MFNFDSFTKQYIKEYNPNWPEIPDHPYRIKIHMKQNVNY